MVFRRIIKAFAIAVAAVLVLAIALAHVFTLRVKDALRDEIAARLPVAARGLGLSVEFDDIALNPITGLALEGVTVSTLTESGLERLMTVKSVGLIHSIHVVHGFRIRIDGVRLVEPHLSIAFESDGSNNLSGVLNDFLSGDDRVEVEKPLGDLAGPGSDLPLPAYVAKSMKLVWVRGELDVSDARAGSSDEPATISLRDVSGDLVYGGSNGRISLRTNARLKGTGAAIEVEGEGGSGDFRIGLSAQNIGLDALGGYVPEFVVVRKKTVANLKLIAELESATGIWNANFKFEVDDVALDHWRIADRMIDGIDLTFAGDLRIDTADRRIEFDNLRIGTDGIFLNASGYAAFAEGFELETTIGSGRIPIQRALEAIPPAFIPELKGAKVNGTIDIGVDFAIDTKNLGALKFEPAIAVEDFELIKAPDRIDIERLKAPFMHKARKNGEVVKEFLVGHPNYWFVPFQRLGENTKKGVLTCEDGSFFRHEGFRAKHFRESIIQDIRERRFARGGSTITMQTAKNLFLTGKKNLSRKFQEVLIAYAMEQELTKERIFEIYMNIIEWGPNIYGVGEASKHYFDKWPKDLGPVEAAFLGSIIPTAKRSHYMYRQGFVPDSWATYLALIVSKMGITGEEHAALEPFQPEFGWVRKKREAEEHNRGTGEIRETSETDESAVGGTEKRPRRPKRWR